MILLLWVLTLCQSPTQRRDMRGPEGVDDIINELQNELNLDDSSFDLGDEKPKKRKRRKNKLLQHLIK